MSGRKGAIPKGPKIPQPFQRSQRLQRSPPKPAQPKTPQEKQPPNQGDISVYLCEECFITDNVDKVCCDNCQLWSHFKCVNVTSDVANRDWSCKRCMEKNHEPLISIVSVAEEATGISAVASTIASEQNATKPNEIPSDEAVGNIVRNTSRSIKSKSTTSSSSRRKALMLQRLEEEQRLQKMQDKLDEDLRERERKRREKRDKEYLDKKYSILEQESDDSLIFDDYDESLNKNRFEEIRQWSEGVAANEHVHNVEIPSDEWYDTIGRTITKVVTKMSSTNIGHSQKNLDSSHIDELRPIFATDNIVDDPGLQSNLIKFTTSVADPINQQTINSQAPVSSSLSPNVKSSSIMVPQSQHLELQTMNNRQIVMPSNDNQPVYSQRVPNSQAEFIASNTHPMPSSVSVGNLAGNQLPDKTFILDTQIPTTVTLNRNWNPRTNSSGIIVPPLMSTFEQPSQRPFVQNQQPLRTNYQNNSSTYIPIVASSQPIMSTYMPVISSVPPLTYGYGNHFNQSYTNAVPSSGSYQPITSNNQCDPNNMSSIHNQQMIQNVNSPIPIQFTNASNANNSGAMQSFGSTSHNPRTISPLTAEQIAARHVIPKELPPFYGDPEDWQTFYSAYENSTIMCGYNNYENLCRIQKSLRGEALESVRSLLVHANAVLEVMHTLFMMYGRPELIIETMIQDIQRESSPKDDDLASIMKFAIKVRNLSGTIRNTGALEHLRNPTLISGIIDKLPAQIQLNWACYKRSIGITDLAVLGDWLNQIAEAASLVVRKTTKSNARKKEQRDQRDKKDQPTTNPNSTKSNNHVNTQVENTHASFSFRVNNVFIQSYSAEV